METGWDQRFDDQNACRQGIPKVVEEVARSIFNRHLMLLTRNGHYEGWCGLSGQGSTPVASKVNLASLVPT